MFLSSLRSSLPRLLIHSESIHFIQKYTLLPSSVSRSSQSSNQSTHMALFSRLRPLGTYHNATTDFEDLPAAGKVKLALCQIPVTEDKQKNIQTARTAIEDAVNQGAQLVVLPEMWNCPYSNDSFPTYAEDVSSGYAPSFSFLSDIAKEKQIVVVGGSIPEQQDGKLYNTSFVFDKTGRLLGRHRKLHLFDIDIPNKITFKESDTLTRGDLPTVVDTDVGRIAIGICYDIRFPELASICAARGAHMIIYPGAFNMTTGPVHWELLQKARAVDNQLFVATCSPARDEEGSYVAWGHSTVVGPFGEILGTTDHSASIVVADLDLDEIEKRRQNMPLRYQRRSDLYSLLDLKHP